ncbi:MAG: hypothetical protein R3F19_13430 [Verrucomicrobiales bacterium]
MKRNGYPTARWTVGKMMRYLGLRAIYSKPRTTVPAPQNAKYPYLLHDIEIIHQIRNLGNRYHLYSVASRACLPQAAIID